MEFEELVEQLCVEEGYTGKPYTKIPVNVIRWAENKAQFILEGEN